jgi:hypothetical protein
MVTHHVAPRSAFGVQVRNPASHADFALVTLVCASAERLVFELPPAHARVAESNLIERLRLVRLVEFG